MVDQPTPSEQPNQSFQPQGYPVPEPSSGSSFNWTWVVVALIVMGGIMGAVWLFNYGQAQQVEAYNNALSESAQQVEDSAGALQQSVSDLNTAIEGIGDNVGSNVPQPEAPEAPAAPEAAAPDGGAEEGASGSE